MNDYAGVLSAPDRARLESTMAEREQATGAQVAIAIFPSLEGESLEDFSIRLAEKWRIGQKGLDNGVIVLVFLAERKMRLEVGYGLEPTITDAVSSQIIRDVIAPRFREGRYADGLADAVTAIYARIEGGPAPPAAKKPANQLPVVGFAVLMIVVIVILGMEARRSRQFVNRRGLTAGGGRAGWIPPIIFFPGGWGRGGGGWGGGGWGGGGGGGGFSGGGGGFGGGGASGDW